MKNTLNSSVKSYTIRKGQLNDLLELQKLYVDTISTVCTVDYNDQQIDAWASSVNNKQRWNDIFTKQFVLVAQQKDKIIGFATLDNGNYLDFLYVHSQNQRQGIAQVLMDGIIKEVKRLNQKTLTSDVSKTARPFFEKNDFKLLMEQTVNRKGIDLINYKMLRSMD